MIYDQYEEGEEEEMFDSSFASKCVPVGHGSMWNWFYH